MSKKITDEQRQEILRQISELMAESGLTYGAAASGGERSAQAVDGAPLTFGQRQGLASFLPVSVVAKEWGISARRVRALLSTGRLQGRQQENGYWEVCYPYTLTEGRRGPVMRKYAAKKPELRLV